MGLCIQVNNNTVPSGGSTLNAISFGTGNAAFTITTASFSDNACSVPQFLAEAADNNDRSSTLAPAPAPAAAVTSSVSGQFNECLDVSSVLPALRNADSQLSYYLAGPSAPTLLNSNGAAGAGAAASGVQTL